MAFCVFEYAAALALDVPQFNRDMNEDRYAAQAGEDFLSGVRRGVNPAPMFCINRARYDGANRHRLSGGCLEDIAKENKQ